MKTSCKIQIADIILNKVRVLQSVFCVLLNPPTNPFRKGGDLKRLPQPTRGGDFSNGQMLSRKGGLCYALRAFLDTSLGPV